MARCRMKRIPRPIPPKSPSPPRKSGLSDSESSEGEDKTPTATVLTSRCVTPIEATQEDPVSASVATGEVVPSSLSPSPSASPKKQKASEAVEAKEAKRVKFLDDTKPEEID